MKSYRFTKILVIILIFYQQVYSQKEQRMLKSADYDIKWFDVNRIRMSMSNKGMYAFDSHSAGLIFPEESGKGAIFAAGLWIFAHVNDSLRCVLSNFSSEYGPGIMRNGTFVPDNEDFTIYKVNESDDENNPNWLDWKEKGVHLGAPVDVNGNPVLAGEQTLWTVFNDANPRYHGDRAGGTLPLGVEVQMMVFGYNKIEWLREVVFVNYKIINKGTNYLRDAYIGFWFDPDLRSAFNDYVGCDPELNLGYCYEADNEDIDNGKIASVGVDVLKGVIDKDGTWRYMTSFFGDYKTMDPGSKEEAYNYLRGIDYFNNFLVDPTTNEITTYRLNGDPVTGQGWIDGRSGDKRMLLSSGPFEMAPGDTQNVMIAIICAMGKDRLNSLAHLRYNDMLAQFAYDIHFKLDSIIYPPDIEGCGQFEEIVLNWNANPELFNSLGYVFEGYNIYQGTSLDISEKKKWKLINTFDFRNGITEIKDSRVNNELNVIENRPVQRGNDSGIRHYISIKKDHLYNRELVNGNPYYFAISSYAYNPFGDIKYIESSFKPIEVIPQDNLTGYGDPDSYEIETVYYYPERYVKPKPSDKISVHIIKPQDLTGHKYWVSFSRMEEPLHVNSKEIYMVWHLKDDATNVTLLKDQWNVSANDNYLLTDGFIVKLNGTFYPEIEDIITSDNLDFYEGNREDEYINSRIGPADDLLLSSINHWKDWERLFPFRIEFSKDSTQLAYFYLYKPGEYCDFRGFSEVPFRVYDIKSDRRVNCAILERPEGIPPDLKWNPVFKSYHDYIVIFASDYKQEPDNRYCTTDLLKGYYKADMTFYLNLDWMTVEVLENGGYLEFQLSKPFSEEDRFFFTVPEFKKNDEAAVRSFKKIKAVPNPYYGNSLYETGKSENKIMFTPLPEKCTIRIFNLAGVLIKTIYKDDYNSFTFWDLKNEYNTPVSSGIYVYVVESKELGQVIGKIALFMESRY